MRTEERIRAVMRVIAQGEDLGEALAELGDILSAYAEENADEAYLPAAQDRLASAKDRVAEALALLRQWLKEAEANDDGKASE
jgi:DNA-binding transcriptional MerR regulator